MTVPDETAVTATLAKFVAEAHWQDLPPEATHQAKRSLMNFFAVALTGCRNETIETALRTLTMFSGGKQATIVGRRERIDALNAAFINAAGSNVLDFCDTHVPTAIHPTAPLAPPLLALGELQRVSGRDLLLAFVLGQEVECRVGLAISPSHYNRGWHITATCGVFGAAAGSGKLLALGPEQMVWALGVAATEAAGLCECLGTPAKSVGVGNAARNGLFAALLAKDGFAGPAEPLNGKQGYYNALAETPNLAALTDGLGSHWEIMPTSYKPYPCGFVLHPALDCVLDWRRDHPDEAVEKVVVIGNPLMSLRANRPNITAGRESQVSVQHSVAAALVTGKAGLDQFTDACVNDPKVLALRGKVELLADAAIPTTAAKVVITAGGNTYNLSQAAARGSDANPMSDKDLEDKLRDAAAGWNPRHDIAPLIDAIWRLDTSGDIAGLAALTVPRS
jgi:2-methylcitrate dehydratase PrpD